MKFTVAVDYYDLLWQSDELFDEQKIDHFLGVCAAHGIDAVQWRVSVCGQLLYHTKTADMFTAEEFDSPSALARVHRETFYKCKAVLDKCDPLESAVRLAHKHGLKIYPWLTLYDDYGVLGDRQSTLVKKYPELCWAAKDGKAHYLGATSYVYPEVVEYRLRQIRELNEYGGDGIYLSNRSHSRSEQYHNALRKFVELHPERDYTDWIRENQDFIQKEQAGANEKYGFDPPAVDAFVDKFGRQPEERDMEWCRFRGGYFTDFMRRVRTEVNGTLSLGLCYPAGSSFFFYGDNFFDWNTMIKEGLIDELHCMFPDCKLDDKVYPKIDDGGNVSRYGWLWQGNPDFSKVEELKVRPLQQAVSKGLIKGIVFFEAYHFLKYADRWKLIDLFI
jgi:hypothetical protein